MTYPLSLPAIPAFRDFRMVPTSVVAAFESPFTLSQEIQDFAGDRWSCEFTLPPMRRATAEPWLAMLLSLQGAKGTLLVGDQDAPQPLGAAPGTPLVKGAAQTGRSLLTDGWTPNVANVLLPGDYIQIGSGVTTRLYKVLAAASSNAGGEATLSIWPRLRESPADNAAIVTSNCRGTFRLARNDTGWQTDFQGLYSIQIECIEAI